MANAWLKEHDQQFLYNVIRVMEKRRTKLQETVLKSDKIRRAYLVMAAL